MQDIHVYIQATLDALSKDDMIHRPVFISILRLTSLLRIQTYLRYIESGGAIYLNQNHSPDSHRDRNKNYFCIPTTYWYLSYQIDISIKNIISFLISQFSSLYTLNYIHRDLPSPYPDDIDDTFSALFAIQNYLPDWTKGSTLATIIFTLDKIREKDTPFLFNTWYKARIDTDTESDSWHSLDIVALSAIVAYFESLDLPCELLKTYVMENIKLFTAETSEFYTFSYMALYLLSRTQISNIEFEDIVTRLTGEHITCSPDPNTLLPNQPDQYNNLLIASICWNQFQYKSVSLTPTSGTNYLPIPDIVIPHTDKPVYLYIEFDNPKVYATDILFDQLIYIESRLGQMVYRLFHTSTYLPRQTSARQISTRPSTEEYKTLVFEHLKKYIEKTHYAESIRVDLLASLRDILNSKDFNIICAVYRDMEDIMHSHLSGTHITHDTLKDFSTLLYAYYLYDQIADDTNKHFLLPFFITLYRAGITALKDIYTVCNIPWLHAESILYTCDSLYMSIFRYGTYRHTLGDLIAICSHIPIELHAHKSCGLQVFLPLICQTIDIWEDRLSHISWYSPLYSYSDYIIFILSKTIHAIQLARQLADDLDDFEQDTQIHKITTAYYSIEQEKLNAHKHISLILRHIDMAQAYLSLLHTSRCKSHIPHTLSYLQDIVRTTKNHLAHTKRDKVAMKELDRLTFIFH
jgi:hypothetical protein